MKVISRLLLFPLIFGLLIGCSGNKKEIVVGTKDFTEQYILGNILKIFIEENTDINVTLKTDLSSDVIFAAIRTSVIDLYVDYTGTIYGNYLVRSETRSPEEIFAFAKDTLLSNYDLYMLDPLGFNNSYNLAVSRNVADVYGLKTISDLAEVSENFVIGGSAEFLTRNDGLPNLKIMYNIGFKNERAIDGVDRYIAIAANEIQVTEAFTTDGHLLLHDLVILEDDKHFFPPYQGAIIIRNELSDEFPELFLLLSGLSGLLTDEVMRGLNYRVDVYNESPRDAAMYFLTNNNLITG